jgi:TolA-binding protein
VKCAFILALLAATTATAARIPTTCALSDPYSKALCAYQRRNFAEAETGFRALVEADAKDPQTVHATYFLARTLMKRGRYDEASKLFIRIYTLDKSFYDAWSCDYLLGECRRAAGKD